jgi:hypothetical protein
LFNFFAGIEFPSDLLDVAARAAKSLGGFELFRLFQSFAGLGCFLGLHGGLLFYACPALYAAMKANQGPNHLKANAVLTLAFAGSASSVSLGKRSRG